MKRHFFRLVLAGTLWMAGCVQDEWATPARPPGHGPRHFFMDASAPSTGGIDPVTLAGMEQSNRAAWDQAQATAQMGNDMANAAAIAGAQAAADAANAAAAQAAVNAANAQ